MWYNLLTPSKHIDSNRPFPNILITWAYSCPSSLNTSALFRFILVLASASFLPPLPFILKHGGDDALEASPTSLRVVAVTPPKGDAWDRVTRTGCERPGRVCGSLATDVFRDPPSPTLGRSKWRPACLRPLSPPPNVSRPRPLLPTAHAWLADSYC